MRAMLIRRVASRLLSPAALGVLPEVEELPSDEESRARIQAAFADRLGVPGLENPNVLTCGHCSIVCGPTLEERAKRFEMLRKGGLVVRGPAGRMVPADNFEQAQQIRRTNKRRPLQAQRERDRTFQLRYARKYVGLDVRSELGGLAYKATVLAAELRERRG